MKMTNKVLRTTYVLALFSKQKGYKKDTPQVEHPASSQSDTYSSSSVYSKVKFFDTQ